MSDFDWDAPTATKPEPTAEASAAASLEWDTADNSPVSPGSCPVGPGNCPDALGDDDGYIPSVNAWVGFRWDAKAERFRPEVVDAGRMDRNEFGAWKASVEATEGFTATVCLDASDPYHQSKALFTAHSYSPGYADIRAAREEFAKLAEAEWARELLRKGGR